MKWKNEYTDWDDLPLIISVNELCVLLRISKPTALKLLDSNKIKAKKTENRWFIQKEAVKKYLGD
ncbi:MAG: helix-turn-helix domain-containing protein [Candidatus Fimenecus sp.]